MFKNGPLHKLNEGVSEWEIKPTFKRVSIEKELDVAILDNMNLLTKEITLAHKAALKLINRKFKKCRPLFQKVILSEDAILE